MSPRVRVGLIGAGMIAQAAHLPNLAALPDHFEVVALVDPSETVRTIVAARHHVPASYADWREMIDRHELDAVLICAPHAVHVEATLAALEAGLHVFVEKPLCIDPADADRIIATRERHGRVVQVGYMKRFDPAYERMAAELPASADELCFVDVVAHDPILNKPSLFCPDEIVVGHDVPAKVRRDGEQALRAQLLAAVGSDDLGEVAPFATVYLDALIHDVNLVNGLLERMGEPLPAAIESTSCWGSGAGATIAFTLVNGARWNCTFLWLPGLQSFREHIAVYFRDSVRTLTFAAPYLHKHPTIYEVDGADGEARQRSVFTSHRGSYRGELEHFYDCIVSEANCRTPAELGRADVKLLRDAFLSGLPDGSDLRVPMPEVSQEREEELPRVSS
jgi:predicted dehydrogenase